MQSPAYWRIRPNAFVEAGVRKIAEREGRPLTNTLHKLLTEALFARERRRVELERIKKLAARSDSTPR